MTMGVNAMMLLIREPQRSRVAAFLTLSTCVFAQTPTEPDAWSLQRVTIADDNAYRFGKWEGSAKVAPRFITMSVPTNGQSEGEQYDLWTSWWTNKEVIPMRWRVFENTLHAASVKYSADPSVGQGAGIVCWPLDLLVPGSRAMFSPGTPGYKEVREQKNRFGLEPVASAAGRAVKLTETGFIVKGPGWYEKEKVYFDFRPLDGKRVELLMTMGGHPSLWEYDGTDHAKVRNTPLPMVNRRVTADPEWVYMRRWGWDHKKNLSVMIEGPFLWMQDPQYVVAERDGDWCVIGPLDAEEPELRAIIAKDPANPLFLIEDVHAGKDYFRQGRQILDDKGRLIGVINVFAKPDDQLREVVQRVVSRRK